MGKEDQDRFSWFQPVIESLSAATVDIVPAFTIDLVENKPLSRILRVPLTGQLPRSSHNLVRTILRIRCEEGDCQLEKVEFLAKEMLVRVIMKRRVQPVWLRR